MEIGFIISMYDEIEPVRENIDFIKGNNCRLIVIQSDPKDQAKIVSDERVDHYELLPDLAPSPKAYHDQRAQDIGTSDVPARALSRNFGHAFTAARGFSADWWVSILGDVRITKLAGIRREILKMASEKKSVGITRAVG